MLNYKIIASDLDGTLLNSDVRISDENKEAVKRYADMGGVFVPSTGRCLSELTEEQRSLAGVRYLICSDGAVIYDLAEGKHITNYMDRSDAEFVLRTLRETDSFSLVHFGGDAYLDADRYDPARIDEFRVNRNFRLLFNTSVIHKKSFDVFCEEVIDEIELICPFFCNLGELEECKRRFEARGLTVAASTCHMEIFSAKAGKGNAILRLAEHLSVPREETISLGDSMNDREMILAAGLGIAVDNACDGLKALADRVACSNDDHVVRYVLENIIADK